MKQLLIAFLLGLTFTSAFAQRSFTGKPLYRIEAKRADTTMGNIVVQLFPAIAPLTVSNWDSLVEIKFFDSTAFHRVVPGFVIQGGDPNSRDGDTSTWGYGDLDQTTIPPEFTALSHQRGILSMARTDDPNSATSQFFICVAAATNLDHKYTAFGQVVSGMDAVDSIVNAPRVVPANRPIDKISMFITKLGSNDSLAVVPELVSPASGTEIGSIKQIVRWNRMRGTMIYHLQLASDADFQNIIVDTNRSQIDTMFTMPILPAGTYYWRVQSNNGGNISDFSPAWTLVRAVNDVASTTTLGIRLDQNFPNPVFNETRIQFNLASSDEVQLIVRDLLGREVARVIDGHLNAGLHSVTIPKNTLHPGLYSYELHVGDRTNSRTMIVE